MKICLNEIVLMHSLAFSLSDSESYAFYDILYESTLDYHSFDKTENSIAIDEYIFFIMYPSIMFKFMNKLLDIKFL